MGSSSVVQVRKGEGQAGAEGRGASEEEPVEDKGKVEEVGCAAR